MTPETTNDLILRIEKTINAPIANVRAALTDPALLAKWYAPGPMTATVHSSDARIGGHYEITMSGPGPDGEETDHSVQGEYTELSETRVAMTFNWTEEPLPNLTHLSYELSETPDGTLLVLTHTGLPTQEAVEMHEKGWLGCLEKLPQACE